MLTHRDRGWAIVRESLRRERAISDLLRASNSTRLSRRVAATGTNGSTWTADERALRSIEHDIRRLDPGDPEFWTRFQDQVTRLTDRYAEAGIAFAIT